MSYGKNEIVSWLHPWCIWTQGALIAIHSIHSFLTRIYIAPLQGCDSEVLPTAAQLKDSLKAWVDGVSH